MKLLILFLVCHLNVNAYVTEKEDYYLWRLIEIKNIKTTHINSLWSWLEGHATVVPLQKTKFPGTITAVVSPDFELQSIKTFSKSPNLIIQTKSRDFSRDIAQENRIVRRSANNQDFFSKYRPYNEMMQFLSKLESSYPDHIRKEEIGRSSDGRSLYLYTITNQKTPYLNCTKTNGRKRVKPQVTVRVKPLGSSSKNLLVPGTYRNETHNFIYFTMDREPVSDSEPSDIPITKPVIFIDAGAHSREWISPAATLYFMEKLLWSDPVLTNEIEWKVIAMANPDGYIHSWGNNRLWRKTRSKTNGSHCMGVDMNRNFDFHFGEVDTSMNPCDEHYGGPHALSEPETVAIRDAVSPIRKRIKAYLSIHNWGQEIMYPMSHSRKLIPMNEKDLEVVAQAMSAAIKKSGGVNYAYGRASVNLYPSSGTVTDWAYAKQNIPLTYTLEMRDKGKMGFFLPQKYIKPTGEDLYSALDVLARILRQEVLIHNKCSID